MQQITQIYMDYSSLPALDEITIDEIKFFYDALIDGLVKIQKEEKKRKK